VICNTLIYGHGRGPQRDSIQLPALASQARNSGIARHVGPGSTSGRTSTSKMLVTVASIALEWEKSVVMMSCLCNPLARPNLSG